VVHVKSPGKLKLCKLCKAERDDEVGRAPWIEGVWKCGTTFDVKFNQSDTCRIRQLKRALRRLRRHLAGAVLYEGPWEVIREALKPGPGRDD
jgi:hypothetical protein